MCVGYIGCDAACRAITCHHRRPHVQLLKQARPAVPCRPAGTQTPETRARTSLCVPHSSAHRSLLPPSQRRAHELDVGGTNCMAATPCLLSLLSERLHWCVTAPDGTPVIRCQSGFEQKLLNTRSGGSGCSGSAAVTKARRETGRRQQLLCAQGQPSAQAPRAACSQGFASLRVEAAGPATHTLHVRYSSISICVRDCS